MSRSNKQGFSRKQFLKTALAGAGGLAIWPILGGCSEGSYIRGARGPAAESISINNGWLFSGETTAGATKSGFDDSGFEPVTLPHTVTELSWREWDPESWEKVWIYRRNFTFDQDLSGKRVFLDFGAAMTGATLYLNGHKVGEHIGGYLPFSFELTDYIKNGANVIAVELDSRFDINIPPNRPGQKTTSIDFWQPGGLYRTADLRVVPSIFLIDVFAKPVDVLGSDRRLEVECTIDAKKTIEGPMNVNVELRNDGEVISKGSTQSFSIDQDGQTKANITLNDLADVRLWDIDDPQLYDVVVTLSSEEKPLHDYATRIGFREARFTKEGFYLNGRHLKIFGLNRHQIYPFTGHAMPERVQRKDAEMLKNELNCNMIRAAHYPQSQAFFDACDELGLMTWEEIPGWGLYIGDEQWQNRAIRQVGDMVRRGRNRPSTVIWGVRCNETKDNPELWGAARDLAHRLDDTRPTTGAMHGSLYKSTNYVQDVFSCNDYWQIDDHAAIRPPRTDFPYLVSEAVGAVTGPSPYYRRDDDPIEIQQGQAMAHAWVHEQSFADDRYCGLIAWLSFDYLAGGFNHYRGVKYNGVVDLFREPKLGAAIYQAQVDPQKRPVIAPAFYWDFSNSKALPLKDGPTDGQAMICSNCDRLELFVNDKYYASVRPDRERFGHLPYPPSFVDLNKMDGSKMPELRIDGYVSGQKVHSRAFSSNYSNDVLSVKADASELIANGSDATRVVFRVLDKYGAPRPFVEGDVSFKVKGPGRLIGDNPFAFEDTGGVGAVWIRSKYNISGEIVVTVEHPYFGSHKRKIHAKRV